MLSDFRDEEVDGEDADLFVEELVVADPATNSFAEPSTEPVRCGICARMNPAQSRFCNQCGTFLDGTSPTLAAKASVTRSLPAPVVSDATSIGDKVERPPSDVGKRALWMVGAGILAVLALYALTDWSSRNQSPDQASTDGVEATPPMGSSALPDSLRARVNALEADGTAASWARIGHIYFTAAMQADESARGELAGRAVDAFELSVEIEDNPDVRTSLAEAAQFDPRNPMRAVQELQTVLETTPDHIAANYLLGSLRARIGRLEGAVESFQRVIALSPASDPIHQRAVEELAAVRQTMASGPAAQ